MHGLFVTGTDTGVGKTFVASMIVKDLLRDGVQAGAYKPACSGAVERADGTVFWRDVEQLCDALGGGVPSHRVCPQTFRAAVAPPVAARMEGRQVDSAQLIHGVRWWQDRAELLVVEGVGGLLCPLTETETVADLAAKLGFPLLVVARLGLGTINHTLLTLAVAQSHKLPVAGIIFNEVEAGEKNDPAAPTNPREIAARCETPVLGILEHGRPVGLLRDDQLIKMGWSRLARHGE